MPEWHAEPVQAGVTVVLCTAEWSGSGAWAGRRMSRRLRSLTASMTVWSELAWHVAQVSPRPVCSSARLSRAAARSGAAGKAGQAAGVDGGVVGQRSVAGRARRVA